MMSGFSTSIKCCIIGSVSVGKTSIVQQYLSKNSSTETTLGAIYWLLNHKTESGNNLKIDFWDTAGQERYNSLIPMYCRNSDIILLTFDITDRKSFTDLNKWLDVISNHNDVHCHIIIVGNKSDLNFYRKIEIAEIQKFINNNLNRDILYLETSAKTGENIEVLFQNIFKIADQKIRIKKIKSSQKTLEFKIMTSLEDNDDDDDASNYRCCQIL